MKPKAPTESPEAIAQRTRAETDNLRAMQADLGARTNMFRRIRSPRISIATGRSIAAQPVLTA